MALTARQRFLGRLGTLKTLRAPWDEAYRQVGQYLLPWRVKFSPLDKKRALNDSILDPTGTYAVRTCAAGMSAGICSPARSWFRLTTPQPFLATKPGVKQYLFAVQGILEWILQRSGFYGVTSGATFYDLVGFGTFGMFVEEDPKLIARFKALPVGQYWLATNENGEVDTIYREFSLTVGQLVGEFGLDKVSATVKDQFKRSQFDVSHLVLHVVEPNRKDEETGFEGVEAGRLDWKGMPFRSIWMESSTKSDQGDGFLRLKGYHSFPAVTPRWARTQPEDVYGTGPGIEALPDVKQLQTMVRRKLQLVEKVAIPPLKGPDSLIGGVPSQLPGAFTRVPAGATGGDKLEPIYIPEHGAIMQIREDIKGLQWTIREGLFADLWRIITDDDRAQRSTAEEVRAKREERLLQLGPVVQAVETEYLSRVIDRVYELADRAGYLPPPPAELNGVSLKVEFLSIMAEAQKAQQIPALERSSAYILSLAQLDPTALDSVNADKFADRYVDIAGLPPDLMRTPEEREALRQGRAQQAAAAQQAQALQVGAGAAKDLSGASLENDNALSRLLGSLGPAAASQGAPVDASGMSLFTPGGSAA